DRMATRSVQSVEDEGGNLDPRCAGQLISEGGGSTLFAVRQGHSLGRGGCCRLSTEKCRVGWRKAATVRILPHACQFFYDCKGCGQRLKPKQGDCCVFCSYGS